MSSKGGRSRLQHRLLADQGGDGGDGLPCCDTLYPICKIAYSTSILLKG